MAVSAWMLWYGLTLFQTAPVFIFNKPDITGNLLWLFGVHKLLLHVDIFRLFLDVIYFLLPFFIVLSVRKNWKIAPLLALCTSLFVMVYAYLISVTGFVSIEVFTAQMFFPLLFTSSGIRGRYYRLHIIRLIFLLIFFSTAIWKIRAGGVFNIEQLSAILLRQHAGILIEPSPTWFTHFLLYLIQHEYLAYLLYFFTVLLEFVFVIGFFTRRYDKILILLFCVFIVFDYFLMEINYFFWLPFLGCLYFSQYGEPETKTVIN